MRNYALLRPLRKKLKSASGETMVETLISILISALALLLLSTAIGTSVNIVRSSKAHMESYYDNESAGVGHATGNSGNVDLDVRLSASESSVSVSEYGSPDADLYSYRRP